MSDFIGVKAALLVDDRNIVAIQRDDKPGLPFAGLWDLPGGGSEPGETPLECLVREVEEELGIDIGNRPMVWQKIYPGVQDPTRPAYFMAFELTGEDVASVVLGNEGLGWKVMGIADFIASNEAVEPMKQRLRDYCARR